MKVLPLPCKLQDVCVGKMTLQNGSPVSTGRCKNNVLNEYCCAKYRVHKYAKFGVFYAKIV